MARLGIGKTIGWFFSTSRDMIARRLVQLGMTPNMMTIVGMLLTILLGICMALAVATGQRFFWAFAVVIMYWAGASDMLDGAMARLGKKSTPFGAFLDSTCDRISDFAIYGGLAVGFACQPTPNVTFMLLSMLAFLWAFMISYTRSRAETIGIEASVGYWQRPERSAAVLMSILGANPGALITSQAFWPLFTVLRRILYTKARIEGRQPILDVRTGSFWVRLRLWDWPRMSIPYDLWTLAMIAWLIWLPVDCQRWDLLRHWFMK